MLKTKGLFDIIICIALNYSIICYYKTVSYEEIFPGNFGVGRVKNFLGKKTFLTRKFSGKISSPKTSSGNFGSNSPSRGNFQAQNFLETRKFYEESLGSLDNRPEISTFSQYWMMPLLYSHTHRVTQTLPQEP